MSMAKPKSHPRTALSAARPGLGFETVAMAQQLVANGRLEAARALANRLLSRGAPDAAQSHNVLAAVAILQNDADAALTHAQRAVQHTPSDARLHFTLGRAHKLAGDLAASAGAYRQAIALDPRYAEAHVSLGIALKHSGELDAAIDCYRRAIKLNPKLAVAHGNLGVALATKAELAARATSEEMPTEDLLRSMEKALRLDSGSALLHRNHGVLLVHLGRYKEASDALNQALGMNPDDLECCLRLGDCLRQMGHSSIVIDLYHEWLASHPWTRPSSGPRRRWRSILTQPP
jgi:protein O-GlcNAc transferase